jgi:lipoprotein signal peptidase
MKDMKERSYRKLFWGLALLGTVLDQVTKYGVFRWLYHDGQGGEFQVVHGVFRLVTHYTSEVDAGDSLLSPLRTWSAPVLPVVNHGALFGLGSGYTYLANLIFTLVSVLAAVAIIWWSTRRATSRDWSLCAALGLILAGTLGNLYDRVVFGGVRDFLHFYLIDWPVFNVADCCLVCGAFLLLGQAFFAQPEPAAPVVSGEMAEAK